MKPKIIIMINWWVLQQLPLIQCKAIWKPKMIRIQKCLVKMICKTLIRIFRLLDHLLLQEMVWRISRASRIYLISKQKYWSIIKFQLQIRDILILHLLRSLVRLTRRLDLINTKIIKKLDQEIIAWSRFWRNLKRRMRKKESQQQPLNNLCQVWI